MIADDQGMGLNLKRGHINPKTTTTAIVKIKGLPKNMRNKKLKLAITIIKRVISHASGLFKKNIGTKQKNINRKTTEKTTRLSAEHPVIL
jgi:hypothetical protein